MISKARAREIDYYFEQDHKARSVTFFLASGIGTATYLFCRMRGFQDKTSLVVAMVLVFVTFYARIATYRRRFEPTPARRWIWELLGTQPNFSFGRRWMLARIAPLCATITVLGIGENAFTETEAVNRGIANLRRSGRTSAAQKLASNAAESMPLDLDNVISLGSEQIDVTKSLAFAPKGGGPALVRLKSGMVIRIWMPIIYAPYGQYRLDGTVTSLGPSLEGNGSSESHLFATFSESPQTPAILRFTPGWPYDILVLGLSGGLRHGTSNANPPAFLVVEDESRTVAVSDVAVDGLTQILDRVIWEETTFTGCSVSCRGGRLQVTNVKFVDCAFTFADNIPSNIRAMLEHNRGERLSFSFNP